MDRFWSKTRVAAGGCLEWTGAKSEKGYGRFMLRGKNLHAHRVAYELACGPALPNMVVMHACDNRACVNPSHLSLGTVDDNNRDMRRKGRGFMPTSRGEAHPTAKLTAVQVAMIRASSMPSRPLAATLGVCPETIQQIRRGQSWR